MGACVPHLVRAPRITHLRVPAAAVVPPDSEVPGQGLQVELQLRIFKIITVDMTSSTLRLQAWQRLQWKDSRLAWNPSEWNGVTEIRAVPGIHTGGAADAPDNHIWEPRLHHYNSAVHPDETLEEGAAWIYPDGTVFQSKPGQSHSFPRSSPLSQHAGCTRSAGALLTHRCR